MDYERIENLNAKWILIVLMNDCPLLGLIRLIATVFFNRPHLLEICSEIFTAKII